MFPKHCREVSLKRVSFPLTRDEIIKRSVGKKVYAVTKYVILTDGNDWSVLKIKKSQNLGLFKRINKIEIMSFPEETGYVEDSTIDVLNLSAMAKLADKERKETLVVKGKFEHLSFICNAKYLILEVYDIVPPNPPKLVELVERALSIGRIEKAIKVVVEILDLNILTQGITTSFTMFPCYMSDLKSRKNTLFLDQAPDLSSIGVNNITLIGCDLSLRIFSSMYNKKPAFINMCPKTRNINKKLINMCITRCCTILNKPYERIGNVAYVPWGAKISNVEEAILDLVNLN